MGFWNKGKTEATPVTPTPASAPVTTAPSSGGISLTKGNSISLAKTDSATIIAENGWAAPNKDYDLMALVRYRNGKIYYVGASDPKVEVLATPDGAVKHSGDVKRAGELERITIEWHPDIASVALSSYSAMGNGTGSFLEYGVFARIINGDQVVGIEAADTSADELSYTLCFGEVHFEPDKTFRVTNLEMYSKRKSEKRMKYEGSRVVMDGGPEGKKK